MSANHKRPLLAFVLVALACSMIIANGIRTQAVVSAIRAGAQHLVTGVELVVSDAPAEAATIDSEPEVTPIGSVEVAAQQVFGGGHPVAPVRHRTAKRHPGKVHHAHSRTQGKQHGHSAPARDHGHGKGHSKAHGKRPGKDLEKGLAKSAGQGHAKGNKLKHQDRDD